MEHGTIVYYYPVKESAGESCVAKKHWWQAVRLMPFYLSQENGFSQSVPEQQICEDDERDLHICVCPVPVFYYKKRSWNPQTLCDAMETVLYQTEGMTDTCLASGVEKLLPEEIRPRWHPRMETLKQLTAQQLAQKKKEQGGYFDKAVVRLGNGQDAEWQMEMTWELLQPYLEKINQCVIWYNPTPGIDIREELSVFLDDYYYEYGLVAETREYGTVHSLSAASREQAQNHELCLDFRKDNLYRSALKYLDTMVKNRYYKLVK